MKLVCWVTGRTWKKLGACEQFFQEGRHWPGSRGQNCCSSQYSVVNNKQTGSWSKFVWLSNHLEPKNFINQIAYFINQLAKGLFWVWMFWLPWTPFFKGWSWVQNVNRLRDAFKIKKSKLWDIGPKGGRGSKQNPKCWSVLNLGHLGKGGGGLKIHVPKLYLIFLLYWMLYMSHVNSVYRGLPVSLTTI